MHHMSTPLKPKTCAWQSAPGVMMAVHLPVQSHSLGSKLALLALHFPRLRIIWSRSLHATADIFRALKGNQDDPDPEVAAAIGKRSVLLY